MRSFGRHLFDIHAAGGRCHDHRALAGPIDDNTQIELLFDRQTFFDQNAPDRAALPARSDG